MGSGEEYVTYKEDLRIYENRNVPKTQLPDM